MTSLVRTAVGEFKLEDALLWDDVNRETILTALSKSKRVTPQDLIAAKEICHMHMEFRGNVESNGTPIFGVNSTQTSFGRKPRKPENIRRGA